jgi:hypothetical protein
LAAAGQLESKGCSRTFEPHDLSRNYHLGPELLSLYEGASGERLAGNTGRESRIVLDAGARPGLAAESSRVKHDHRQTLGCCVNGGRKSGRTGFDDRNVVSPIDSVDAHHPDGARQIELAGILENCSGRSVKCQSAE